MNVLKIMTLALLLCWGSSTKAQIKTLGKGQSAKATTTRSTTTRSTATRTSSSSYSGYDTDGLQFGGNLIYGSKWEGFGLGGRLFYGFNGNMRFDLSYHWYFEKDHVNLSDVNLNFHYLFPVADRILAYPLAGATIMQAKVDVPGMGSTSSSEFGFNLGGGAQYEVADNLALDAEIKFQSVKGIDQLAVTAGIIYKF